MAGKNVIGKTMKNKVICIATLVLLTACGDNAPKVKVTALKGMVGDNHMQNEEISISTEIPEIDTKTNKVASIDIGGKDKYIHIDSLVESCRFIPLETNEKSLVGDVTNIQFDGDRIFVYDSDNSRLIEFNDKGKFICRIGSEGRGPGEYIEMGNYALDKENKQVFIYDNAGRKLECYDYNGRHMKSLPVFYSFSAFAFNDDNIFALTRWWGFENKTIPNFDKHQLIIADRKFVPEYTFGSNDPNPYSDNFTLGDSQRMMACDGGVYYTDILAPDTIWLIGSDKAEAVATFTCGKRGKAFSVDETRGLTYDGYYDLLKKKNICDIDKYAISKDFIYAHISTEQGIKDVIYCRHTGHFTNYTTNGSKDVKALFYNLWRGNELDYTDGKLFYRVLQPYKLASYRNFFTPEDLAKIPENERRMFKSFKEEDNPILMVFKFKEF